jgi:FkbM family methyltransferase
MPLNWREQVKGMLLKRGMIVSRPPGQFNIPQVKLANAKRRGLQIRSAIDGGAYNGGWARELREIYPDAQVLSIEPREECIPDLEQAARDLPGVRYAATCIGSYEGEVQFNVHDSQSSMLDNSIGQKFGTLKVYPITRLDTLVQKLKFPWPDLIKLDLQGAELEALRGGTECLKRAQALFLEVSFIPLQKNSPLLFDVVSFCHEHGFRVYDISGLWHRPLDGALAQGDFFFIREDHPLVADARWSEELG